MTLGSTRQQNIEEEIRRLESHPPNTLTRYKSVRKLRGLFFHPNIDGPKQHQAALRDLKIARNSYNPACKLPYEILSDILLDAQALSRFDSASDEQWLGPTAVCHYWRQTTLNTPRFWSDILVTKPHLTALMIQRSNGLPLRLCFNLHFINYHLIEELHATSMVESRRVEEMHIRFNRYYKDNCTLSSFFPVMPTFPVPALQRLTLEQNKLLEPASLPQGIIWQDLRSLRSLKFISVLVPRDMPNLPALQHFEVDFRVYVGRDLSFLRLIELLLKMPLLETLKVGTVSSSGIYPDVLDIYVPLPHLRILDLTFQDIGEAKIFKYLTLPDDCRIAIQCRTGGRPDGLYDIVQLLEARAQPPIHRGTLSFLGKTTITLKLYHEDDDKKPTFELDFPYYTLPRMYRSHFLTFSPLTRVPEVEVCFVSCEQDFGGLLAVLDPKIKITTLSLNTVDCSTEFRTGQVNGETLLSVLKEHAVSNIRVKALKVHDCKMSRAFMDELSQYTQIVQ
ncbi:hypothetical protein ONZ45_g5437 [Pleurotus djamor]|nr:hypothetical protein ONZ45_g5437 [Pleurotus djamor]